MCPYPSFGQDCLEGLCQCPRDNCDAKTGCRTSKNMNMCLYWIFPLLYLIVVFICVIIFVLRKLASETENNPRVIFLLRLYTIFPCQQQKLQKKTIIVYQNYKQSPYSSSLLPMVVWLHNASFFKFFYVVYGVICNLIKYYRPFAWTAFISQ